MKAAIYLDVPEWQIGKDVSVYFPDTMLKHGKCELPEEQKPVVPKKIKGFNPPMYLHLAYVCDNCKSDIIDFQPFCAGCGRPITWEGR